MQIKVGCEKNVDVHDHHSCLSRQHMIDLLNSSNNWLLTIELYLSLNYMTFYVFFCPILQSFIYINSKLFPHVRSSIMTP